MKKGKIIIILLVLIILILGGFGLYKLIHDKQTQNAENETQNTTTEQGNNSIEPQSNNKNETAQSKANQFMGDAGIFSEYYDKAYEDMSKMTTEEKIGQVLLVRVPETNATEVVKKNQFGGYILFGRDTKNQTAEQIKAKIKSWNEVSKVPLIIATDEEGGTVVRVSSNTELAEKKFPSSQEVFAAGGYEAIKEDTMKKVDLLYSLGINVNLAPVADVSTNSEDFIYARSFGKSAKETAEYIKTVVETGKTTKVSNVLKHFPGYGNNVDTHTGISIDERSLQSFYDNDFLPFISGINEGVEGIMVSHNIIVNVENSIPASLSKNVHDILRQKLNFTGIIMTDDIAMSAVKDYVENPCTQALKAGNDMIIISDYESGIAELKKAIEENVLDEEVLDRAVTRVLAWKYYKGMM